MELLGDPALWTAIALVIFVIVLVVLKVPGTIAKGLDGRATAIKTELDEARRLRDEAHALLADHVNKQNEAARLADAIIAEAREAARRASADAAADLAQMIERRRRMAQEKIGRAEEQAVAEIKSYAAEVSVGAAARFIQARLDRTQAAKLIDSGIAALPERLRSARS